MITGTSLRPARFAARQRRSPAMIWYSRLPVFRTTMGCMIPSRSMDCVNSMRAVGSKSRRGWLGLGIMRSIARRVTSRSAGGAVSGGVFVVTVSAAGRLGMSDCSPLPSALRGWSFLVIGEDLFGQLDVSFRPLGAGIVKQNRFAMAGRLGKPDAARDDSAEHVFAEEFTQVSGDLFREVRPLVVHRKKNAFYLNRMAE